jgi:ribulose-phosphate 3-epimerase
MGWDDWVRGPEIEPSIYAADFARLADDMATLLDGGAKIFQFDVGDGHFVEPITIGPIVLQAIAPLFRERGGILDVHLMVDAPDRHFPAFAGAGADSVTVHYEVTGRELPAVEAQARELGLGFGLAFNPETAVDDVAAAAAGVDLALCMGVHPGYSGQAFIPETVDRVARLRELLPAEVPIQVDGGVGLENVRELRDAGATLFVAGSSVFAHEDPVEAYRELAAAVSLAQ